MKIYNEERNKTKHASVRIPTYLWDQLEKLVRVEGGSRSKHVIQAVDNYVRAYNALNDGEES